MRHVASKIPSVNAEGAEVQNEAAEAEVKEAKKASRRARKEGNEDEILEETGVPGTSANEEERLEQLYEQIAWPLGKKYGHPYDAFKLALTCVPPPPLSYPYQPKCYLSLFTAQ